MCFGGPIQIWKNPSQINRGYGVLTLNLGKKLISENTAKTTFGFNDMRVNAI